jgi:hypothetical protein
MATRHVKTAQFRVDFPNLFEPQTDPQGNKHYSVTMIFDSPDDIASLKEIVAEAKQEKWGDNPPSIIRSPFRPGQQVSEACQNGYDLERYPQYTDKIIVSAKQKADYGRPYVADEMNVEIPENRSDKFYSGCYAVATVVAYAWSNVGGNGISFGLQGIQKVADGDRLGGGRSHASIAGDFAPVKQPAAAGANMDMLGV